MSPRSRGHNRSDASRARKAPAHARAPIPRCGLAFMLLVAPVISQQSSVWRNLIRVHWQSECGNPMFTVCVVRRHNQFVPSIVLDDEVREALMFEVRHPGNARNILECNVTSDSILVFREVRWSILSDKIQNVCPHFFLLHDCHSISSSLSASVRSAVASLLCS